MKNKRKHKRQNATLYNITLVDARDVANFKAEQEQLRIIQDISENESPTILQKSNL